MSFTLLSHRLDFMQPTSATIAIRAPLLHTRVIQANLLHWVCPADFVAIAMLHLMVGLPWIELQNEAPASFHLARNHVKRSSQSSATIPNHKFRMF